MANASILAAFERMWQHVVAALGNKSDISHSHGDYMTVMHPAAAGYFSLNRKSGTTAGDCSFAEGYNGTASGHVSHAEGDTTTASGNYSHSEGAKTTASGAWSHAEGYYSTASGSYSHAEGYSTIASAPAQHAQGKYNVEDTDGKYAHIVGNGTANVRANIHTLDWDGNAWFEGDVKVGGTSYDDASELSTKTYVDSVASGKATNGHGIYYGTCSTAADTAAKVVTLTDATGFSLTTGAVVVVKFTNANSIASPTLNVNSTGAKSIYRYGTTAASTSQSSSGWRAGAVQIFVYDGTGWIRDFWENSTYSNVSLGQGYATCSTAAATTAKTASLSSYALTTGGVVAVKFTYSVPASATLNINSKGAKNIYYRGAAITANVIKGGDIATFIYDGSRYQLLSVDRWHNDIASLQSAEGKVNQVITTANANYPLLLAPYSQTDTATAQTFFDSGVYLNPSTNKIYANISGTATSLEGLTATVNELNSTDGVTSNIQTQLDGKVPASRTVNGKALSGNISLTASDVGATSFTPTSVSIAASAWSSKTATVSCSAVTASNTLIVAPAPASYAAWGNSKIRATAQTAGQITFTCDTVPTATVSVNIVALG